LGKPLVLYFYPKDNTPGCTTEAQQFRDLHGEFVKAGCVVIGVSRDALKSHESFKAKLGLPFELISDIEGVLCRMFDVIKQQDALRQEGSRHRAQHLPDRRRRHPAPEWRSTKADGNAAAVLETAAPSCSCSTPTS
jgi:peroxiredoxin Q/BCP